jgi:hypothetical protein
LRLFLCFSGGFGELGGIGTWVNFEISDFQVVEMLTILAMWGEVEGVEWVSKGEGARGAMERKIFDSGTMVVCESCFFDFEFWEG